jgi:hypothetical protein
MTQNVDLNKYEHFVAGVTSDESMHTEKLCDRLLVLESEGINAARLLTASMGLSSEGGEFNEIVKKLVFQGKELNEGELFHMKRELGDIIWYWITACGALGFDPNEIVEMNVDKLKARYPGGTFDVHFSENRQEGDL